MPLLSLLANLPQKIGPIGQDVLSVSSYLEQVLAMCRLRTSNETMSLLSGPLCQVPLYLDPLCGFQMRLAQRSKGTGRGSHSSPVVWLGFELEQSQT